MAKLSEYSRNKAYSEVKLGYALFFCIAMIVAIAKIMAIYKCGSVCYN